MKRIVTTIIFIAVFSILFTFSALADVIINYNPDTLNLSVSGVFEDSVGKAVTLQIIKPGKTESDIMSVSSGELKTVIYNLKETKCNSEGIFSFQPFKINGTSGYYGVRVCVNGHEPLYFEKGFLHITPEFETHILSNFCDDSITAEELADILSDASVILDFSELSTYDEEQCVEITKLIKREANTTNDITINVNVALAVYKINNSYNTEEVNEILEYYGDYISPQCSVYDIYTNMDSEGKKAVANNIIKKRKYESSEEFVKFFGDNVVFTSIYTMDNYLQLEKVLDASEEWFGVDFSSYFNSKNKKKVALEIIGKQYDEIGKLERAIKNAVENAQDTSTSSNGNGGGGGNGGTVISIPQTTSPVVDIPSTVVPTPDTKPMFDDMLDAQWAVEAVESLSEIGIINGVSQNKFAPNSLVTREQFIKMVIVAFGDVDMNKVSDFVDCPKEHWSSPYVASAYDAGIVNGVSDTKFGVGQNISRQDMAVMLYRAAKNAGILFDADSSVSFNDEENISPYAKEAVITMAKSGIISGMGDGNVAPLVSATRAQAAKMIYELIKEGVN